MPGLVPGTYVLTVPSPMSAKLARTIHTTDGATLRTREEAAEYMTALPEQRARYNVWQHAARLPLDGADADMLTTQIEFRADAGRASARSTFGYPEITFGQLRGVAHLAGCELLWTVKTCGPAYLKHHRAGSPFTLIRRTCVIPGRELCWSEEP